MGSVMTDETAKNRLGDVPEIAFLCETLKQKIDSVGGKNGFTEKYKENPNAAFDALFSENRVIAHTFFRLIDDAELREKVLQSAADQSQLDVLKFLFDEWAAWAIWDEKRSNTFRITLDSNSYDRIREQFNFRLNDVYQCHSLNFYDPLQDEWRVQVRVRLAYADKGAGESNELFVASSASSFVGSVNLLLAALRMTTKERQRASSCLSDAQRAEILSSLDVLKRTYDSVRSQFESEKAGTSAELT